MDTPFKEDDLLQEEKIPEVIEEYLEHHASMKCMSFNRRGTLLAAGCSNGSCVIWDFETRVIAKELKDEDSTAAVTSVCWSKHGHCILVSNSNKKLILWDVASGEKVAETTIRILCLNAQLHPGPGCSIPSLCLVNPVYSAPFFVDLNTGKPTVLPTSVSLQDSTSHIPSCFNNHGDLVYLGNSKGEILIIAHHSIQLHAVVCSSARGVGIKNIVFSRNGKYLLTNSNVGTIRVYENTLPLKDGLKALCEMGEMLNNLGAIEKLMAIGTESLRLCHKFHDLVSSDHWKGPCFSSNSKFIICGSADEQEHKIHIWDQNGRLVKILKGPPKDGLINLCWHPVHPIIVSLSTTGLVYIWAKDYAEKWSAFYPGFKELDDIVEYVEREDEFDVVAQVLPPIRKVEKSNFDDDVEVDVVTIENDSMFSDSETFEGELCYLQSVPCPYSSEQQDRNYELNDLNPMKGIGDCYSSAANVTTEIRPKRQRKPTEKLLESLVGTAMKTVQ